MERSKQLQANVKGKELSGLILKEGEKEKLYNICIKYSIPITYPDLFNNDTHYYIWGISKNGIGLISTIKMNHLSDNNVIIFNSSEELEIYLKENQYYGKYT